MGRSKVYGMIGYWREYVPDFAARTRKLKALLSSDATPWTKEHTAEFKAVVQAMVDGLPLLNFAPGEPAVMETNVGPRGVAAVYLQQDAASGRWLPVAAYSRETQERKLQEQSVELLELAVIQEALRKMPHIALGASDLVLRVSEGVAMVFRSKLRLGPELVWRVCDIMSYGVRVLGVVEKHSDVLWSLENRWSAAETEEVDAQLLRRLATPARVPKWGIFRRGRFVHVAFDSSASKTKVGTAGYVIANANGEEVVRKGVALGAGLTNNEAESTAALLALQHLARLQDDGALYLADPIRVLGDSQLVIRFLLRVFRRSTKPSLYLRIEQIKALVAERGWVVSYRYVPRQLNPHADDMCRRARAAGCDVEYSDGELPEGAPGLFVDQLY